MASYIDSSLIKGEFVVQTFKHHWTAWIPVWLCIFPGMLLLFPLLIAVWLYFALRGTERAVTNRRVIQKTGIISRHTDEMKLNSIETVEIRQGILARILGAGTVKVTGLGISDVVLRNVDDPLAVKKAIEEADQKELAGATTPVPA